VPRAPWIGAQRVVFDPEAPIAHPIKFTVLVDDAPAQAWVVQDRPRGLLRSTRSKTLAIYALRVVDWEGTSILSLKRRPPLGRLRVTVFDSAGKYLAVLTSPILAKTRYLEASTGDGDPLVRIVPTGFRFSDGWVATGVLAGIADATICRLTTISVAPSALTPGPPRYVLDFEHPATEPLASVLVAAVLGLYTSDDLA
jgi:hypothetical protein